MKRQTIQPPASDIMTLRDAALYLNCHPQTVYRLLRKRVIPGFRVGGLRFRRLDLDKWMDDQTIAVSETEAEPANEKAEAPAKPPQKAKPKPSPRRAKKRGV
jgi:excisionase family DNA binding protein